MSAPRPDETSPFHPPALFTFNTRINYIYIYIYIYKAVPVISSMWYLQYVLVQCILVMYACAVSASFTPRFRAILKLFCLSYGNFGELMQNTYLRICSTNKSTYESCIYKIIERTTLWVQVAVELNNNCHLNLVQQTCSHESSMMKRDASAALLS